ncbi:MAG: polysaccharide ABC transporter ATP-binding protein [Thermodesulfobacteriota bacterium]
MSEIAIKVRNIGKEYRIGEKNDFRTIRDSITYFTSNNLRKLVSGIEGIFVKKSISDVVGKPSSVRSNRPNIAKPTPGYVSEHEGHDNYIWSLRNVSFDVREGEIVGIIGRNGAGKSTLLKIISGITEPTEGRIDIYGRIASLLEVGTGFHQELTGRENIYLNGALLGMKKREIDRKFDEIVDFSEIDQFIDMPVKFYSSGMRVRLGFSVAAHLEPEILLIDEALAVGDAAFQKKCLGKLNNVASSEGRTVIFVSHDMAAIQALCQRAVLLESGKLIYEGPTYDVVQEYMQSMSSTYEIPLHERTDRYGDGSIILTSLSIENAESGIPIKPSSRLKIKIGYRSENQVRFPQFILYIKDFRTHVTILRLDSEMLNGLPMTLPPNGCVICETDEICLSPGRCYIDASIRKGNSTADYIEHVGYFDIEIEDRFGSGKLPSREQAIFLLNYKWHLENF